MNIDALDDEDLEALEDYIRCIRKARSARLAGAVATAKMHEWEADEYYSRLSEDVRW